MSGLLFLSPEDFHVTRGTRGNILCHSIPGFSLILFYSNQCEHCQIINPIFRKLPGTIGGCQFGMTNVSVSKEVVRMSRDTIAPITYVPYIVLYINGKPFMKYQGPYDADEIKKFVLAVSNNLQNKQKFSSDTVKDDSKSIPAYTIGHPLKGQDDRVCYLEFDNAYGKPKQAQQRPMMSNMPNLQQMQIR